METLIAILTGVLAGAYIIRRAYRSFKNPTACNCGCSKCEMEGACDEASNMGIKGRGKN